MRAEIILVHTPRSGLLAREGGRCGEEESLGIAPYVVDGGGRAVTSPDRGDPLAIEATSV
jgi:hypothetical protein